MAGYARIQETLLKEINVKIDEENRISVTLVTFQLVDEILSEKEKQLLARLGWMEDPLILSFRITEQLMLLQREGVELDKIFPKKIRKTYPSYNKPEA